MGQFVSVRLSQQMNLLRLSTESNEQSQFPHHFMLDMLLIVARHEIIGKCANVD